MASLLNTVNGKKEEQAIVSVLVYPETLADLNMNAIDPSDAMRNFRHNMKFSKINGFSAVDQLEHKGLRL